MGEGQAWGGKERFFVKLMRKCSNIDFMTSRDDFSLGVKNAVAARAGWHCSFEGCNRLTIGPSDEAPDAKMSVGEAAHICAAAPGGRRYDPCMSPVERGAIDNAIWLCAHHARVIDRDEVTHTADKIRSMKRRHEDQCEKTVTSGSRCEFATGLLALGPDIICTADIDGVGENIWVFHLENFLKGDVNKIVSYIGNFKNVPKEHRYILCNEFGDGRELISAPLLKKQNGKYELHCAVAESFPRVSTEEIKSDIAVDEKTNDLALDGIGGIAIVSGVAAFSQRVKQVLSMQQGESPFHPSFGAFFFKYFEEFRGSPWLNLLFKLDVIRQASIPYGDRVFDTKYTPLQCVTCVRNVEILADAPTENWLPVRVDFEVKGFGAWQREFSVYMPTVEQMIAIQIRKDAMSRLFAGGMVKSEDF